jgi:FtsZ-binding cell division protein ZapB
MDGFNISKTVKWVFIITMIALIINSGWIYSIYRINYESGLVDRINILKSENKALNQDVSKVNRDIAELIRDNKQLVGENILLKEKIGSLNQEIIEIAKYPKRPVKLSLDCLSEDEVNLIKKNPIEINNIFQTCEQELRSKLVSIVPSESYPSLNQNDIYIIFVTIVAYQLAPYGDTPHFSKIEDLLDAYTLDCSGYTLLVGYMATLRKENLVDIDMHFVGWQSSAIGNHVQIFFNDHQSGINLLLDPTIALIAVTTFDQVASGKPIDSYNMADFSSRATPYSRVNQEIVITYSQVVINALIRGEIKPSDLLYYYENLQHYLGTSIYKDNFITPGGVTWRHIYYPEYYDLDSKK